jgi:predicted metal-binding protein
MIPDAERVLTGGGDFERYSAAIDTRTCRSCGARIAWLRTTSGRLAPVNADGISHFATCPQAEDWRKRKATREEAGL